MADDIILYNTDDGRSKVSLMTRDGNVWLNQAQMAELFDTSVPNINIHVNNVLKDRELDAESVIKDYLITANDGKRYNVKFYSLSMILAVGFRVRSPRGVQFRRWANANLSEYLQKGFVIDDERLKNPNGLPDYFDELLERIKEIRVSEKRFYQKVRELFALSSDYDPTDKATQMFFAETQNKLLYAVTSKTAAEIIMERANANKPNMGLTSWKGKVVRKGDVIIAKNYLDKDELSELNQLVIIFLDSAEFRAKRRKDTKMSFWRENVDMLLKSHDLDVWENKGSISAEKSEEYAKRLYDEFNERRRESLARAADLDDLKLIEEKIKDR